MANKLRLTIFSVSCCHPQYAAYDKQYVDRLKQALQETGLEADLNLITATEAQLGIQHFYLAEIQPLFKKYGAAVAPALFINEHLKLYGGVPTLEKLKEVMMEAANDQSLTMW
ncbi:MAG: thioredoxin family protein [Methanomassiliicoccales archaeon]|nr:thioredoxin family protein [Methanomassiliicoccales archaeon]TFG57358.1 MAG: hypothetical protein E4H30_00790 [Methanomassiliicoccus sp.]